MKPSIRERILETLRSALDGIRTSPAWVPSLAGGFPAEAPQRARPAMLGGGGASGSEHQEELLITTLDFILRLKKQCGMYLNANVKAYEFPAMGSKSVIVSDRGDMYKYAGDPDKLFIATFNTLSELISRDQVMKRLGLRLSTEEFSDLGLMDRTEKIMRKVVMIYQILCSNQSSFKNLRLPGKIESALG